MWVRLLFFPFCFVLKTCPPGSTSPGCPPPTKSLTAVPSTPPAGCCGGAGAGQGKGANLAWYCPSGVKLAIDTVTYTCGRLKCVRIRIVKCCTIVERWYLMQQKTAHVYAATSSHHQITGKKKSKEGRTGTHVPPFRLLPLSQTFRYARRSINTERNRRVT